MTNPEDRWKTQSDLVTELANILSRCLVPLFTGSPKGKPQFIGTSFLVSSSAHHYLVSAAHVFDHGTDGSELWYYIEPMLTQKLWGKLHRTTLSDAGTRKNDRFDVGVLEITGGLLPPYPKVGRYPMPLNCLQSNVTPREGKQYLVFGFPGTKHRLDPINKEVTSELCIYRTHSADQSSYEKLGVQESTHIVMAFDREKSVGPDGKIHSFPKPFGMSGSPVWLLIDEEGPNDNAIPPIVGVVIEYHKVHRAILATDIGAALGVMGGA